MRLFSRFDSSSFSFSKIKSLSLLLLMPSIGMAVTTWNVDSNEDSDTWTSGHRTLRGALTRAAAGDTITLTALAGDTITLTNNLPSISYSVTIQGTGDPVSIDGTNTYHMFNIASGTVSLSNLHLENAIITGSSGGSSGISSGMNSGGGAGGGGLGAGAALFVGAEANVVLSDVSFENNRAVGGSGGGYNGVATTTGGAGASFQLTAGPTATTLGQMDAFSGQFGQGGAGGAGGNGSTAPLAGGMGGFGAGGGGGGGDSGIESAGIGGISSGGYGGIGGNGGALANGSEGAPGGGGAGLGGAIFVQPGGAVTVARSTSFSSNTTIGGSAGVNSLSHSMGALDGGTAGNDLFLGSSSTLILDASSGDLVMENVIAGYNGNLVKSGSGEALLTGLNTYSGNTTIQAGALGINSGGCLSTGPVTFSGINASTLRLYADGQVLASNMVFNAGLADFDLQNNTTTLTGLMSGTGALNLIGDGSTLILAGTVNNTYAGGTFLNPGSTLSVGTEDALGAGDLSLDSATLTWRNSVATEKNLTLLSDSSINVQSNNITLLGTATGTGALTKLGSGKLILSGSNNYSGGTIVAAGTLQVASDTALGSGDLTLDNATILRWDGAASSSKALTLSGTATIHTGTYSVAMSGTTRGTGSLNKNGSGTLTLTGSSSYSGGTTVMAGTLAASSDAALGTGSVAIADGSTLQWTGDTTSSKALSLSGTATIGIGTGLTVTMSGTTTGSASLTKEGSGLLILTGSNSYSAGTHLVAGTLRAATDAALGSGNLSFEGGDLQWNGDTSSAKAFALLSSANIDTGSHNVTMSGIGSGTGRLTKIGSGNLTLTGSNTYSGGTTIAGGSLAVARDDILGTGTLALSGGTLQWTVDGTSSRTITLGVAGGTIDPQTHTLTLSGTISGSGAFTVAGTGGTLILSNTSNTYSGNTNVQAGTLSVASDAVLGSGNLSLGNGTLQWTAPVSSSKATTLWGASTMATGTNNVTMSGTLSGTGSFSKTGSGTLTLSGTSTYSGGTTILGGILAATDAALGAGNVSIGDGTTLQWAGNAFSTKNFTVTGTASMDTQGYTLTMGGSVTGSGNFTKSGSGTLTLTSASNYSGGTTIAAGFLASASDDALGTGDVRFTGGALQWTGDASSAKSFILSNDASIDTNIKTIAISGTVSSTGRLTKLGTGVLTLSGSNSYSGGTTIQAGTLAAAKDTSLGTGALTFSGGNLQWTGSGTSAKAFTLSSDASIDTLANNVTMSGTATGPGALTKTGSGVLTLSGSNSYSGGTTFAAGTLAAATDISFGAGNLTFTGGNLQWTGSGTSAKAFTLSSDASIDTLANNVTMSGTATGPGALTKTGSGILTLSGSNSYSGGTTLAAGTLAAATDVSFGAGNLTFTGGNLQWTDSVISAKAFALSSDASVDTLVNNVTMSGTATGLGALTKTGSGVLTLSGSNSYSGGTILAMGSLIAVNDAALGAGNLSLQGSTTLQWGSAVTSSKAVVLTGTATIHSGIYNVTMSGTTSGTGALVKNGSGTLTLTGSNSYSGGTNLASGVLVASSDAALGTGNVAIADGATLQWNGAATTTKAFALAGATTISTGNHDVTMSGMTSGTGSLTKIGSGTLTLSGTSSYSGDMNVNGGTLAASNDTALGSGNLSFGGGNLQWNGATSSAKSFALLSSATIDTHGYNVTMSGTGTGSGVLTKTGAGTLTLSGSNTNSGDVVVAGGTLSVTANQNLGDASNSVTLNQGALQWRSDSTSSRAFVVGGGGGTIDPQMNVLTLSGTFSGSGALTLAGTSGTLTLSNASNTYSGGTNIQAGTLAVATDAALGTGSINFTGGSLLWTGSTTSAKAFTLSSVATINTGIYNVTMSGTASGTASLTKLGYGTLTLSGSNSYSGGTTLLAGTLAVPTGAALGTGTLIFTEGNLKWTGSATSTNAFVLSSNASIDTGGYDVTMSGTASGFASLMKTGLGVLTLSGSSNYSGMTTLVTGGILASSDAALGTGSLSLHDATTLQWGSATTSSKMVNLAGAATIDTSINNVTMSGTTSGSGSLTKVGSGTLTLSGSSSYSGGTNVNAGTLAASNDAALGSGNVSLGDSTTLQWRGETSSSKAVALSGATTIDTGSNNVTMSGTSSGSGSLTKSGSGTLTLSGSSSYSGGTTLAQGTLAVAGDLALGSGGLIFSGGTLQWNGTASSSKAFALSSAATINTQGNVVTMSGTASGTGALNKIGSGNLILSGSSSYSGGTTISAGTLSATSDGALGSGGLTFSGGTLQWNGITSSAKALVFSSDATINTNGYGVMMSGTATGTGALTKAGWGTLTLSGSSSYAGGTTITTGSLIAMSDAALGTGNITVGDSTTLQWGGSTSSSKAISLLGLSTIHTDTYSVAMSGTLSGSGSLTKTGSGTLTLSSSSSYSGGTNVTAGTLAATSDAALGSGGLTFLGGGLQWNGETSSTKAFTFSSATTMDTNGYDVAISGTATGTGALTKAGSGTLTLSGSNSHSGGIAIVGGTLAASSDTALGTGSLTFAGGSLQWNAVASSNKAFALSSPATIDTHGYDVTMSGTATGTGALTKTGNGTLTLSGSNSHSGGTILSAGTVAVSTETALGTGGLTFTGGSLRLGSAITSSKTLNFTGTGILDLQSYDVTISGTTSGSGAFIKNGTGTLTLSGPSAYSGNLQLNAGTLKATGINSLNANVATAGETSLQFMQSSPTTYGGSITGSGSLVIHSSSVITFTGTNTHTGGTQLNAGTLAVSDDSQLGNNSSQCLFNGGSLSWISNASSSRPILLSSGGGTVDTNSHNVTMGGIFSGSGALSKEGSGTLTLTGTNTYTGGTLLNNGIVIAVNDLALGSGPISFQGGTLQWANATNCSKNMNISQNSTVDTHGSDIDFTGVFSGNATLTKTGEGVMNIYTGNSSGFNGTLVIDQGEVKLNTTLGCDVILEGGRLTGTGVIGGDVNVVGGVFAPGNSPGTITISGDFTQGTGTTYYVQIEDVIGDNSSGECTLTNISGSAIIEEGSTIDLTSLTGYYYIHSPYTILTATGGVTGTYDSILTHNLTVVPDLIQVGNSLELSFYRNFFNGVITSNDWNVANQLESIVAPTPGQEEVLNNLIAGSTASTQHAFNELSGSQYTNVTISGEEASLRFLDKMGRNVRSIAATPKSIEGASSGVWIDFDKLHSHLRNSEESDGYTANGFMATLAAQYALNKKVTLGGAIAYQKNDLHEHLTGKSLDRHAHVGGYALYRSSSYYLLAEASFGMGSSELKRTVTIFSKSYEASLTPKHTQGSAYVELGKDFSIKRVLVQPYLGLLGGYAHDEFGQEKGASSVNLKIANKSHAMASSRLGCHFIENEVAMGLNLMIDLAWQYRISSPYNKLNVKFAEFGENFKLAGVDYDKNSLCGALSLGKTFNPTFSLYIRIDGLYGDHLSNCGGCIGATVHF